MVVYKSVRVSNQRWFGSEIVGELVEPVTLNLTYQKEK
jgi:hypothetical protein